MEEVSEYLDYIVKKLKEGKSFSIVALNSFANEQNIDVLDVLLLAKQRIEKEKINLPKAQKFAKAIDNAILQIEAQQNL
jgi:hypothetical protein